MSWHNCELQFVWWIWNAYTGDGSFCSLCIGHVRRCGIRNCTSYGDVFNVDLVTLAVQIWNVRNVQMWLLDVRYVQECHIGIYYGTMTKFWSLMLNVGYALLWLNDGVFTRIVHGNALHVMTVMFKWILRVPCYVRNVSMFTESANRPNSCV